MIELGLKDYCHKGCMNFKVCTEPKLGGTIIKCVNAKQCEYLIRYLTNHAKEDINDHD